MRVIGRKQRHLPDNTQHSKETDVNVPDVIGIRIPASDRLQILTLGRPATGIGRLLIEVPLIQMCLRCLRLSIISVVRDYVAKFADLRHLTLL
jgi:hypothetical protein